MALCVSCKKDDDNNEPGGGGNTGGGGGTGDHAYVDLGLPSGLLWATCNVGADSPEDYGDYFAWGETETKSTYNWSTYKWCNNSDWPYDFTKYNTESDYGTVDNKTVLEMSDDAAHVNWGGGWRMPTKAEMQELKDNCPSEWTTQNGVNGRKFTGPNGESIFLPAAGYYSGGSLNDAGSDGCYWSSSLGTGSPYYAYNLYFRGAVDMNSYSRYCGLSVRPVCPSQK